MRSLFGKQLLVFSLLLSACAHSHRGSVVRLNLEEEKVQTKTEEPDRTVYNQAGIKSSIEAVPSDKDDAAVFYFSLAQAYSLDGDIKHAIEAYRATLAYDAKSPLVHARLAAELVKQGSYAEAKELCEKAIQLDPKYLDSYLLLAGIQVSMKEYEHSLNTYKKILAIDPKNRDALLYYGVTLAETGKQKEAIHQLEVLVKMKESADSTIDQSVAHYYLAKVYQQNGDLNSATKQLHFALKKRPGFARAALLAADIYLTQKNNKQAFAVLDEAFKENHQGELAEKLAEMSLESAKFKDAVIYLETLVEEDPENANLRLRLALVYWQLTWFDKARLVLSDLHKAYPDSSEVAFYLGELEMERKEPNSAIIYYKKVHEDYAKYEQAVNRIAFIYRNNKKYEEGIEYLGQVIKKRPDMVALYPLLAAIYEDEKKLSDAVSILEQGRERFPEEENILYYLGFLYDRVGKKEEGLDTMQNLLQINPNNASALNFVGYTLLERDLEMDKVGEYLGRAIQLKPQDPFVMDSYGWYLFKKGMKKEAMVYLERAFSAKQEESVIAEHLADVYVAMNLANKALAVYQKVLGSETNDKEMASRVAEKVRNLKNALAERDEEYMANPVGQRLPASFPIIK